MLCQGSHRELIPSVRFGTLGETLAPDAECLVAQRDAVSAGFYQPLKAAAGSKAGELYLQAVDPGEVTAGVMITALLVGREVEPARNERVPGTRSAEVDDSRKVLLLLPADRGASPGTDRSCDLTIEQGSSQLDGVARNNARVEAIEPTGMHIIPGAVFDHHMVVDAVAFRFSECAIGQLEHSDGTGSRSIPIERIPGQSPAPIGPCHGIAGSFHLCQRGEEVGGNDSRRMLTKERPVFLPSGGRILIQGILQREQHFGRLIDRVVGPVQGSPETGDEDDANKKTWEGMSVSPRTEERSKVTPAASGEPPERGECEAATGAASVGGICAGTMSHSRRHRLTIPEMGS